MNNPTKRMSARPRLALMVRRSSPIVAVLLLACACATPIGVTHVDRLAGHQRRALGVVRRGLVLLVYAIFAMTLYLLPPKVQ